MEHRKRNSPNINAKIPGNRPSNETYQHKNNDINDTNPFSLSPNKEENTGSGLTRLLIPRPGEKTQKPTSKTLTNLYERTKKLNTNKEKKSKAIFDEQHPFKPKINQLSDKMIKLAKQHGKDLHHSTKQKLFLNTQNPDSTAPKKQISLKNFLERNYSSELTKIQSRNPPQYIPVLDRIDASCTFYPVLDEKSKKIAKTNQGDLYTRAMRKSEERSRRSKSIKEQKEIDELRLCTFTPVTNSKRDSSIVLRKSTPENFKSSNNLLINTRLSAKLNPFSDVSFDSEKQLSLSKN